MCAAGLAGPWSLGPEMPVRPVRAGVPASSESWLAGISLAGSGVAERRENTEKMDCPRARSTLVVIGVSAAQGYCHAVILASSSGNDNRFPATLRKSTQRNRMAVVRSGYCA